MRLLIARPLPGVGERQRKIHLFPVPADGPIPDRLKALCPAVFERDQLEELGAVSGMPCEICLSLSQGEGGDPGTAVATSPGPPSDEVAERLTVIEGLVQRIAGQVEHLSKAMAVGVAALTGRRIEDRDLLEAARKVKIRLNHLHTDLLVPHEGQQAEELRRVVEQLMDLAVRLMIRVNELDEQALSTRDDGE
ncbi:hypothetical protein [Amycolatopsis anabasis]|uniref:hypothetical protein n=1 Tax=Amycolatopsis anabasis TaxID=1840409 RepID=UPI0015D3135E|nr:hypothetical protein [Amycolatopsis anabasis]